MIRLYTFILCISLGLSSGPAGWASCDALFRVGQARSGEVRRPTTHRGKKEKIGDTQVLFKERMIRLDIPDKRVIVGFSERPDAQGWQTLKKLGKLYVAAGTTDASGARSIVLLEIHSTGEFHLGRTALPFVPEGSTMYPHPKYGAVNVMKDPRSGAFVAAYLDFEKEGDLAKVGKLSLVVRWDTTAQGKEPVLNEADLSEHPQEKVWVESGTEKPVQEGLILARAGTQGESLFIARNMEVGTHTFLVFPGPVRDYDVLRVETKSKGAAPKTMEAALGVVTVSAGVPLFHFFKLNADLELLETASTVLNTKPTDATWEVKASSIEESTVVFTVIETSMEGSLQREFGLDRGRIVQR